MAGAAGGGGDFGSGGCAEEDDEEGCMLDAAVGERSGAVVRVGSGVAARRLLSVRWDGGR
jgi:hypothetical protein